jgi:hypothetical protein
MSTPFQDDFNDVILNVIFKLFQQQNNHCQYQAFLFLSYLTNQVTRKFEINEDFLSLVVNSILCSKSKTRLFGFSVLTNLFERSFIAFNSLFQINFFPSILYFSQFKNQEDFSKYW